MRPPAWARVQAETPVVASDRMARLRPWTQRAFLAYALALALAAGAVAVQALHALGNVAEAPSLGRAILGILAGLVAAGLGLALAARTAQLAGAVARPSGVPSPGRAVVRAAQALALLAGFLGLIAVATGRAILPGIALLAASILGLLAAAAWTSRVPGARARASVFAVAAGLLWLLATLGDFVNLAQGNWPVEAAFAATLPSGAAILVATAAVLALAMLASSPTRTLAYALAALAALLGAVQAFVLAFDLVGAGPWDNLEAYPFLAAAAIVLALCSALALAAASILGAIAAVLTLARYGPDLVARAGAGFMAPEPVAACPACRLVAPPGARFCADCGQVLPPRTAVGT